jgi:TrmH family RNA methyltransferase
MNMKHENGVEITSLQNPRIKEVVKLRKRSHRDELGLLVVEGYREIRRALDNAWKPQALFHCSELFQGSNEGALIEDCASAAADLFPCSGPVFHKIAYRDRPEGLLAVGPQVRLVLADLQLPERPLLLVAEMIEKPGNLGTMLRTADAVAADAVIVCDRCTDINNPNVVRASIGTLFALPVVEASSQEALEWLRERHVQVIATAPDADKGYTDADLTGGTAIVVGSEQYGLKSLWLEEADTRVSIPMLGQCDSLNVASAATILLYEAVRQRQRTPA